MAKIRPLHDKVLVERLSSLEKTAGGIVLPDTAKEKPTEGRIVAVGAGKTSDKGERVPLSVKPGDRVLFGSFSGTTIKEGGKELLILDEQELLGVIDDAPWAGGSAAKASADAPKAAPAKPASKPAKK
jgi:chaperonin GroES